MSYNFLSLQHSVKNVFLKSLKPIVIFQVFLDKGKIKLELQGQNSPRVVTEISDRKFPPFFKYIFYVEDTVADLILLFI